jgi:hypothetical protein
VLVAVPQLQVTVAVLYRLLDLLTVHIPVLLLYTNPAVGQLNSLVPTRSKQYVSHKIVRASKCNQCLYDSSSSILVQNATCLLWRLSHTELTTAYCIDHIDGVQVAHCSMTPTACCSYCYYASTHLIALTLQPKVSASTEF